MTTTVIQATSAYELSVGLNKTPTGHHLQLVSYVPSARRPEHQVRFSGTFSLDELRALRDAINRALEVRA